MFRSDDLLFQILSTNPNQNKIPPPHQQDLIFDYNYNTIINHSNICSYAPLHAATNRRGHPSTATPSSRTPQQGDRMILPAACADDFAATAAATDDSSKLKRIMHREIERQRRQEMATLYASLRSLLPLQYVKGKRSTSDHMHEALNYIKQMQKNVQELGRKRERLKTAAAAATRSPSQASEKKAGSSADKIRAAAGNFVSVSGCRDGVVEVLINCDGGERGSYALSRAVGALQKEGVEVVSCASTRADNNRFLHCLLSQVCSHEEKGIDLQALQHKLNDVINL